MSTDHCWVSSIGTDAISAPSSPVSSPRAARIMSSAVASRIQPYHPLGSATGVGGHLECGIPVAALQVVAVGDCARSYHEPLDAPDALRDVEDLAVDA